MNLALGDVVEQISSAIKIPGKNGVKCDRVQIKDKQGNVGWTTLHSKFLEKAVAAGVAQMPAPAGDPVRQGLQVERAGCRVGACIE